MKRSGMEITSTDLLDASRKAFDELWKEHGLDWVLKAHEPGNDRGCYPAFLDAWQRGVEFGASNSPLSVKPPAKVGP